MADRLMRFLYRPGWRLRCIDPPIAWLRVSDDQLPVAAIRLQLTCYLTSRLADDVRVKDTHLVVAHGERRFVVPAAQATDIDGALYSSEEGYEVGSNAPHHVLVDFVTDAPDLVAAFGELGPPLPIAVAAQLNRASSYREIASLELARIVTIGAGEDWRQVGTGRELER